ncbi:hypothetical protein HMPREF2875_06945 [Corynebacterium sp. HMSC078H07]|nr:hypothetical protein HMPREF2875_06945 [Corynebacterium sp. HMSC078H07]
MAKWTPMNKNTSPQSRSATRPRSQMRGHGQDSERTERPTRRDRRAPAQRIKGAESAKAKARRAQGPTTLRERIRRMLMVVAVPNLVVVLSIIVVVIAALLLTSSPSAWFNTIVAEAWMVFNLAPIRAGGIDLGFLPGLPAVLLAWLVGRRVRVAIKDKVSINDLLVLTACVFAVPLALTCLAWLMLWDAGKAYDVSPPALYVVLPRMLLLHAAALIGGMGTRLWKALAKRSGVPRVLVDASRIGLSYLGYLAIVSLVLVLVLWAVGWQRQADMLAAYPVLDAMGTAGLVLLSILYLPNAVIAAASVLSGSELHVGPDTSISLFSGHMVPLPPLPLAAAVPPSISSWAVALFVLPAIAAGVAFARRRAIVNFQVALVAAVVAAVAAFAAIYGTSGTLGVYGYTGPELWTAVGLIALWCLVVGAGFAAANALMAWLSRRGSEGDAAVAAEEPSSAKDTEHTERAGDAEDAKNTEQTEGTRPANAVPVSALLGVNSESPEDASESSEDPDVIDAEVVDAEDVDKDDEEPEAEEHTADVTDSDESDTEEGDEGDVAKRMPADPDLDEDDSQG